MPRHDPADGLWQTDSPPEDVQTIIDLYRAGALGKDLAAKFGISLSSIRRLLRTHGGRLSDHHEATD